MMPVYIKMMITAMLSVTAVILYVIFPSDLRKNRHSSTIECLHFTCLGI